MRSTCHNCPHLDQTRNGIGGVIFMCKHTGFAVPHRGFLENGEPRATFWRVPLECPLPDTKVRRSELKAPASDWVTVRVIEDGELIVVNQPR